MMKVKDVPYGCIVWKKNTILGIAGVNLDSKYNDVDCVKLNGNDMDYELVIEQKQKKKLAKREDNFDF